MKEQTSKKEVSDSGDERALLPPVHVTLQPSGHVLAVSPFSSLRDILFDYGVEFPCGGHGRCRGCRVKILSGAVDFKEEKNASLSEEEWATGWRLACQGKIRSDCVIEVAQWETSILGDDSHFDFEPQPGLGIAVDLGTTTLVAQLIDMQTGVVLSVKSALNQQAIHGSDIMSRIQYALNIAGSQNLTNFVRKQIGDMIHGLLKDAHRAESELNEVILVGNTVMHHLFCGMDVRPLASYPFESDQGGEKVFNVAELGWPLDSRAQIRFLPCLGGFVGSDILAGIIATKMHESDELSILLDLGTNGEIVVGNRDKMLCASTAAGPAFEGARISMGMRAATGAISEVFLENGQIRCTVIGSGEARGICGSGLVDAVAIGLNTNRIKNNGRLAVPGIPIHLSASVVITQADIRELQLAKGAIAAGIQLLIEMCGASIKEVRHVFLSGAFGNYINRDSAFRIGLYPFNPEQVIASGNTALLGAKWLLFQTKTVLNWREIPRKRVQHVSLSSIPKFQDVFADQMFF